MKKICLLFCFFITSNLAFTQTWSDQVACILYSHCTSCHNPNGIAPGNFTDYNTVFNYKAAIKNAVENKRMPPYPPNTDYKRYAHERKLKQTEIDIIKSWVDNNAPSGNLASAPATPIYNSNFSMVNPNSILSMPTYTINTSGGDVYRCFPISVSLGADKYISEIEVIPGNRQAVHHVLVFQDSSSIPNALDLADPGPGYTSAGTGSNSSELISAWVPGQGIMKMPTNFGMRIKANTTIILQVHYPSGLINEIDSTKIYLKYATSSVRNTFMSPLLNHGGTLTNGPLFIPANTIKTFNASYLVQIPGTVLSVAPHMHKVGQSIKSFGVTNTNDTIPLIDIPKWDFNWQGSYQFQKPIYIPIGTTLYSTATYNNTSSNPFNPSNPPQNVSLGEATSDEMMLIYFNFALYNFGDENIIIDTADHGAHHLNCDPNNGVGFYHFPDKQNYKIVPNPSNGQFTIQHSSTLPIHIMLYDVSGKLVYQNRNGFTNAAIQTKGLTKGMYILQINSQLQSWKGKLIIE